MIDRSDGGDGGGSAVRRLGRASLDVVRSPYRRWSERRRIEDEARQAGRELLAGVEREMTEFHEQLWSSWPEAVEAARRRARTGKDQHNEH